MALFGRWQRGKGREEAVLPLPAKKAFCTVCNKEQTFTKCWRRNAMVRQCTSCNTPFENAGQLYQKRIPVCPHCGEHLEHPGFDYGLCDGCGSKFEVMDGTKPTMLPNKEQRASMEQYGRVWSKE